MKESLYKVNLGEVAITVTFFANELGAGRRDPLGEVFDNISNIHRHAEYETFFIWDGEMELVTERENMRFENSVVILPPDFGHYTGVDAERLFVIYMSIDRAEGDVGKRLADRLSSGVFCLDMSDDEKFYLERLEKCKISFDLPHLISLLFSELLSRIEPEICCGEKDGNEVGKYAFALEEYIEKHYSERIRLCDIATALHLCEKQVSRVIKKEYGCSFTEYVNRKRMAVAVMMLKHTDMTVGEIARTVGFDNDNYFYRVFKEKRGMTPTEYRNDQKTHS